MMGGAVLSGCSAITSSCSSHAKLMCTYGDSLAIQGLCQRLPLPCKWHFGLLCCGLLRCEGGAAACNRKNAGADLHMNTRWIMPVMNVQQGLVVVHLEVVALSLPLGS